MKFTIRDLFLVTVIVALALGWWVEHIAVVRLQEEKDQSAVREREVEQRARRLFEALQAATDGWYADRISQGLPVPKTKAPAPIAPKKQSGPDNRP